MIDEQWRPVVGYEGTYEVSSEGRIRSLTRIVDHGIRGIRVHQGKIIKQNIVKTRRAPDGYYHLSLALSGTVRNGYVHQLVCEAFHGPRPSPEHVVRHLNGKSLDNHVCNVVWGTKSENAQDKLRHGTVAYKTHCIHGHEYTAENTVWRTRQRRRFRVCRECKNSGQRAQHARRVRVTGLPLKRFPAHPKRVEQAKQGAEA